MARKFSTGIDLQNQRAQNVAAGTQPSDGVNLGQMQAFLNGLDWKQHVRLAATGNVNLSSPGTTFDSVAANQGDRILLPFQTTASQNNVYIFNGATSPMTVAADFAQGQIDSGDTVAVMEGATYGATATTPGRAFTLATKNPITVGTTALNWVISNSGTVYTVATGLTLSAANQIGLDTSVVARKAAATIGDGSTTSFAVGHTLATLDVSVQLVLISTGETIEADVTRTNASTVTIGFGQPPIANSVRVLLVG